MDELRDYLTALIDRFQQQPIGWQAKLAEIEREKLRRAPTPEEWSPHQVVAHVMAADKFALQPRLRRIMSEDQPELLNWDEEAWMADSYQKEADLSAELKEWKRQRSDLGESLVQLKLTAWNRTGWHPLRGERTLLWWLEYAVKHAADHEEQLAEILAQLE